MMNIVVVGGGAGGLELAASLGRKVGDYPEPYVWVDPGGDAVHVEVQGGQVSRWQLQRAAPPTA